MISERLNSARTLVGFVMLLLVPVIIEGCSGPCLPQFGLIGWVVLGVLLVGYPLPTEDE